MNKVAGIAIALAVGLALAATPAGAVFLTPGNYPTDLDLATHTQGPTFSTFAGSGKNPDLTPNPTLDATLTGNVWLQGDGTYVYALTLDPVGVTNITDFGTIYSVPGFDDTAVNAAGYSFSNAITAGAGGTGSTAFDIEYTATGRLTWSVSEDLQAAGTFWDSNHLTPITFYFVSSLAPDILGNQYSMANSGLGETTNDAPAPAAVPEPASLFLLGSGLLAFGLVRRSFR